MEKVVVGGIEGGATYSTIVLLDSDGKLLSTVQGACTNLFLLGIVEVNRRIAEMVNRAKAEAGINEEVPLNALGLSLSGCESEATNQDLIQGLRASYPNLSKHFVIGSDTQGSVMAVSNKGGMVCISGTGSNTLLINPDGSTVQCGGWGNILGDEGSAWSISFRAIKICFDHKDNFAKSHHPIDRVWSLVQSHFDIVTQSDILPHFYTNFDKAKISSLCKKLSDLAKDGDGLSVHLFTSAGEHLARAMAAVIPKASSELTGIEGGLQVVCIGSVWLSWDLLKTGFVKYFDGNQVVSEMRLVRLTTGMAHGAAYMAADKYKLQVPREYEKNFEVFYHYKRGEQRSCVAM